MITFDFIQLLVRRKWRWAFVSCMILLSAIFVYVNMPYHESATVAQLIMLTVNQHFFTIFVIPLLFVIVTGDLILLDQQTGYLQYVFVRSGTRFQWFLSKFATVFFAAFLLTCITFLAGAVVGVVEGVPGGFMQPALGMTVYPLVSLFESFLLFVGTLLGMGSLLLTVSLLLRNTILVWVTGAALAMTSYFVWYQGHGPLTKWMPTTQILYFLHMQNDRIQQISGFTLQWTLFYSLTLTVVVAFVGFLILGRWNLTKTTT